MVTAADWTLFSSHGGTPGPDTANRRDVAFVPGEGLFWIYQDTAGSNYNYLEVWDGSSWSSYWNTTSIDFSYSTRMVHDPIRGILIVCIAQVPFGGALQLDTYEITLGATPSVVQTGSLQWLDISWQDSWDIAWDSTRNQVVFVGGARDTYSGTTYARTYTYNTGTGTWTKAVGIDDPATHPDHRTHFGLEYDASRDRIVYVCGMSLPSFTRNDDVWEYDPGANTWSNPTPATTTPAARSHAEVAYNPVMGGIVMFGGIGTVPEVTLFDGVWVWDGSDWSEPLYTEYGYTAGNYTSGPAPDVARYGFYFGYDSGRDELVITQCYGQTANVRFGGAPLPTDTREWAPSPTLYFVTVDIDEGQGSNNAYDGYDFIQPYNRDSSVVFNDSDGYDGYSFEIKKYTDLELGEISVDATVDGYEEPINIEPAPGSYDVARSSTIKFRVRKG
jgi:hypothetical protein